VIAGQFSRGKEIRERGFNYETLALLILVGKRLGQSPSHKYRSSTKCKALFSFDWVFHVFVFTSIGTEKGHIFIRWAPFQGGATAVWGGSCPNSPPWIRHCCYVQVVSTRKCYHPLCAPKNMCVPLNNLSRNKLSYYNNQTILPMGLWVTSAALDEIISYEWH